MASVLLLFITRLSITRSDSGLISSVVASIINNTAIPAGVESNATSGDGGGGLTASVGEEPPSDAHLPFFWADIRQNCKIGC